jgi:hypothetical protein
MCVQAQRTRFPRCLAHLVSGWNAHHKEKIITTMIGMIIKDVNLEEFIHRQDPIRLAVSLKSTDISTLCVCCLTLAGPHGFSPLLSLDITLYQRAAEGVQR